MEKEKKEETENLLHECALLMNEYFRNQRSLFTKNKFLKQKPLERL